MQGLKLLCSTLTIHYQATQKHINNSLLGDSKKKNKQRLKETKQTNTVNKKKFKSNKNMVLEGFKEKMVYNVLGEDFSYLFG